MVVVSADHGASFVTGQPRRPASRANIGAIAPVPLFVKLPGQREGRVDDRSVRTTDVLPTIAAAAGARIPWRTDGMPARERAVDASAPIDVSHAGEPALTEPLRSVLAKRAAREDVEARLLRDGLYAIGPRPELLGRRAPAGAPARRVDVDPEAPVLPSFIAGDAGELAAGAELAVAVNGRVEATTRVYRDDGRSRYAALVPPESLRAGANEVAVYVILRDGRLRPLEP